MEGDDPERNKALICEIFARVINNHDAALAAQFYAEDYLQHNPAVPKGLSGLQQFLQMMFEGYPDLEGTIVLMLAEGDRVMTLVEWRGTQLGAIAGVPPTGETVRFRSAEVFRVRNGLLVEHWDVVEHPAGDA